MNTIKRAYVFNQGINKHALPNTIINYGKIQFSIRLSWMLHHKLAKCNTSFVVYFKLVEVEEREKVFRITPAYFTY